MKTFKYIIAAAALSLSVSSCYDLTLEPKGVLSEDLLLQNEDGVKKYLTVIYQDLPIEDFTYKQDPTDGDAGYATDNEKGWHIGNRWTALKGSPSAAAGEATARNAFYGDSWGYWPYARIRDINNFIAKLEKYKDNYTEEKYNHLQGEAHFLRAYYYFGLVKRYGGVPIVKDVLDPFGDQEKLQQPRDTEYDCWKFIHDDLDFAMKNAAGKGEVESGRANKYAAAALMSRAMLYAGCIAKYGGYMKTTGPSVDAGYQGIQADKAKEFFQYSYDACKFIKDGGYKLHTGADKVKNYMEVFIGDNKDDEDIFVKSYAGNVSSLWNTSLMHMWDCLVLPKAEGFSNFVGCVLQPTWELIRLFEMPAITDADGKPVRFNKVEDLWDNEKMEARCKADFFFPGMKDDVTGKTMDIQAGVYKSFPGTAADAITETPGSENDYNKEHRVIGYKPGETQEINGQTVKINGEYGVVAGHGDEAYCRTGAVIRKYVDYTAPSTDRDLMRSKQAFKVFRYGEILCNWAEAAYELGLITNNESLKQEAFEHVNELRDRAGATRHEMVASPKDIGTPKYGFPIDENLQYIRDERERELCLENQQIFDLRRWRVADKMFQDGKYTHGILAYKVLDENKYIFLNEVPVYQTKVTFYKKWYYDQIPDSEISKNPKLIRNDGY